MRTTGTVTKSDDYETTDANEAQEYLAALRQAMAPTPSYLQQQAAQATAEWNTTLQESIV